MDSKVKIFILICGVSTVNLHQSCGLAVFLSFFCLPSVVFGLDQGPDQGVFILQSLETLHSGDGHLNEFILFHRHLSKL